MTYVTKFYLIYDDNNEVDYQTFKKIMFEIQNKVRKFKNLATSKYFMILQNQMQFQDENGRWPKPDEVPGYKIQTDFYHMATAIIPELQTSNTSCVSNDAYNYFSTGRRNDIISGKAAIPSYKRDQPIGVHNNSIKFSSDSDEIYLTLSVLSNSGKKEIGIKSGRFKFKVWHKCKSSIDIIARCMSGEYKVGCSKITYDNKKGMFEFALSYTFDAKKQELDKNKILGIDLGIAIPVVMAISGSEKRWFIHGDEIQKFRATTEEMRRQMSKARVYAGDGSVGHGRNTRCKPVDRIGHRIANFRDTKNGAWSREIVDIAVKNGCGVIQMEDLSGITSNANKFLRGWTYYDLQQKIKYKAEAEGIEVVLVEPKFTSQRCSKCGHIAKENRLTQANFVCEECGFTANADYNAARNIATKDIAYLIKSKCERKANKKTA